MSTLGLPELAVLLLLSTLWLIPIAAGVWAIVTLHQLRVGQDAVRGRLDRIEQLLQRT